MDVKDEIKSNTDSTLVVSFGELIMHLTVLLRDIYDINFDAKSVQSGIVNIITKIPDAFRLVLQGIDDLDDKVSLQPTKQEIAEIVNKAISLTVYSYNGANKRLLKNPINKV